MQLTSQQLIQLKNDINASSDPTVIAFKNDPNPGNADAALTYYNSIASPTYFVYRTSVVEQEYTRQSGIDTDGTTTTNWSWTTYIGRSQGERDAWPRLFMGGQGCSPSLPNVRQAFADIFSGAGGANQRTHLSALSRRAATRAEKLLAVASTGGSGARGAATNPDTMTVEGEITSQNLIDTRSA
jgi:hypothetical protein